MLPAILVQAPSPYPIKVHDGQTVIIWLYSSNLSSFGVGGWQPRPALPIIMDGLTSILQCIVESPYVLVYVEHDGINCAGLSQDQAKTFVDAVGQLDNQLTFGQAWQWITRNLLRPEYPMAVHEYLHGLVFADWSPAVGPPPAWFPEDPDSSNIAWLMRRAGKETYRELYAWSVSHREEFWTTMIERLGVRFRESFGSVLDLSAGCGYPQWLVARN